jgi:hypothetical protein
MNYQDRTKPNILSLTCIAIKVILFEYPVDAANKILQETATMKKWVPTTHFVR